MKSSILTFQAIVLTVVSLSCSGCRSTSDLFHTVLIRPTVILKETGINTGLSAEYRHEPLMDMYFTRDQSITTPKGHILCRMNGIKEISLRRISFDRNLKRKA